MQTVWKFPLGYDSRGQFGIEAPAGARPLTVNFDPQGVLVLWAAVDSDATPAPLTVTVVGTGQKLPPDLGEFVNTFSSDPFVFHAFVKAGE